jgi:hypothetical protein
MARAAQIRTNTSSDELEDRLGKEYHGRSTTPATRTTRAHTLGASTRDREIPVDSTQPRREAMGHGCPRRHRPLSLAREELAIALSQLSPHTLERFQNNVSEEARMGDKSPKSKQRDQKQKDAAKTTKDKKKDAVAEAARAVVKKK